MFVCRSLIAELNRNTSTICLFASWNTTLLRSTNSKLNSSDDCLNSRMTTSGARSALKKISPVAVSDRPKFCRLELSIDLGNNFHHPQLPCYLMSVVGSDGMIEVTIVNCFGLMSLSFRLIFGTPGYLDRFALFGIRNILGLTVFGFCFQAQKNAIHLFESTILNRVVHRYPVTNLDLLCLAFAPH